MSDGSIGAGLTDAELGELHSILYDYVMYGEDRIVYTEEGDIARSVERKVFNEAKARKLWWAR